jgi:glycosyltransferase involved in cell wall biosynthesis
LRILISVIIPTYNRTAELDNLLDSLRNQDIDKEIFEIIIVDQNDLINLENIILKYSVELNINHIKMPVKGISHAKNIGIKESKGEIITFIDDDAKYYPDTLKNALQCFNKYKNIDIFYGRLFDRERNRNILRKWKKRPIRLNICNFYLNYVAIATFTKRKELLFDERFGVGTDYAMGEEFDYILRAISEKKYRILFTPEIEVWHPDQGVFIYSGEKTYQYSFAFGSICKMNLTISVFIILLFSISYQFLCSIYYLILMDKYKFKQRWLAFKGRIDGFFGFVKLSHV